MKNLNKRPHQSGRTTIIIDRTRRARSVGWRTSRAGRMYYENRKNRSDVGEYL